MAGPKCWPKTSSNKAFHSSRARNLISWLRSVCDRIEIPCSSRARPEEATSPSISDPEGGGTVAKLEIRLDFPGRRSVHAGRPPGTSEPWVASAPAGMTGGARGGDGAEGRRTPDGGFRS